MITAAAPDPGAAGRRRRHRRPQHDDQLRPLEADRLLHRVLPLRPEDPGPQGIQGERRWPTWPVRRCARPAGTSSMANLIKLAPEGDRRSAPTTTPAAWCCSSRARSTRSPATTRCSPDWPPRTRTPWCRSRRPSPPSRTGLGINADDVDFVRFVNARLAQMRSDGEWTAIYNRWLSDALGPAPAPPQAGTAGCRDDDSARWPAAGATFGAIAPAAPGRLGTPLDADRGAGLSRRARALARRPAARARPARPGGAASRRTVGQAHRRHHACRWRCGRRSPTATSCCVATWDSGRVGPTELERMSALIWGRLDATLDPAAGPAASSACPAWRCRCPRPAGSPTRWSPSCGSGSALDPSGAEIAERIRQLRAQLERIRDQVDLEAGRRAPSRQAAAQQAELAAPARARSTTRPAAAATSAGCSGRWRSRPPRSSAT